MIRRALLWLFAATAVLGATAGVASAFWSSIDGSDAAVATADALPTGATPTASRTGATLTVGFARSLATGGAT